MLTTTAVALILDIMLSLRLCLRPTIIADSLGPDQAQPNKMFNVFIDKTVRCAGRCDFVGLIQQSRDTYIYRRVVRKANSDMSRLSQGLPIFIVGKSIHSEIVKQTAYYGKSVYEANRSSTFLPCVCGQLAV